jgi:hypothetical protein
MFYARIIYKNMAFKNTTLMILYKTKKKFIFASFKNKLMFLSLLFLIDYI